MCGGGKFVDNERGIYSFISMDINAQSSIITKSKHDLISMLSI